jgi:multiple sugar transport system permease protein/N,N'-diacetylchitobiose transport system permease protein
MTAPARVRPDGGTEGKPPRHGDGPKPVPAWRRGMRPYLLSLPAVLIIVGILYPFALGVYYAFLNYAAVVPNPVFVGLRNFGTVLSDPAFWSSVRTTLVYAVAATGSETVLGIGIALLLNAPLRARWLFRTIVVLPWALPTIVNGAMWRYMFNAQYGVVNAALTQLHIIGSYEAWFSKPFLALNLVILADVWKNTSLVAFFLLAGVTTIPRELYEAARVDGYGPVGAFFQITLPLLRPVIVVVLVLRTIEAFKVFDIIYVMTGGGPANGTQSIAFYTYQRAFSDEFFGYGSALAYLIVIFIMALAVLYIRLLRTETMASA